MCIYAELVSPKRCIAKSTIFNEIRYSGSHNHQYTKQIAELVDSFHTIVESDSENDMIRSPHYQLH